MFAEIIDWSKIENVSFFSFEIKRTKTDKIFNFLKGCFSVMSGPTDMIFGVFPKTNVRLLKNIISHFFSKYNKSYNIKCQKLLKTQRLLTKKTGCVEAVKLHVSNRTLQELSRIVLIKSVVFVVSEILHNLVSMQIFLNTNNCWRKQNFENFSTWPYLFNVLSESLIGFVSYSVF